MKKSLAALFATTALMGAASAADFGVDPGPIAVPAPAQRGWTGFYVGGHVGYGWGESQILNRNNNHLTNPAVLGSEIPGVNAAGQDL